MTAICGLLLTYEWEGHECENQIRANSNALTPLRDRSQFPCYYHERKVADEKTRIPGDEKKRRDSMDTAGYSVLSNDDVCRMFDQYSYKHRQKFGALFEGRTLLDSIRTTRNVSLERRSIIGPMKRNVKSPLFNITLIFLTTVNLLLQFAESASLVETRVVVGMLILHLSLQEDNHEKWCGVGWKHKLALLRCCRSGHDYYRRDNCTTPGPGSFARRSENNMYCGLKRRCLEKGHFSKDHDFWVKKTKEERKIKKRDCSGVAFPNVQREFKRRERVPVGRQLGSRGRRASAVLLTQSKGVLDFLEKYPKDDNMANSIKSNEERGYFKAWCTTGTADKIMSHLLIVPMTTYTSTHMYLNSVHSIVVAADWS
ncbi:TOX high mobility group box family member 3-like isoform X3 [Vespula maculifrons]|uniref:TOX high mobility group box family member 3-like isoform X3 n=1 Tax=Vespula maculifrons TaxID=7453 RepID=A0ABD2B5X6_VESMC